MNTSKNEFLELDKQLELLKQQGKKVPTKKMIKTKQQIEGIKKAAIVNSGLLDYIEENIKAGMSTKQIDIMAKNYTKNITVFVQTINIVVIQNIYVYQLTTLSAMEFLVMNKYYKRETLLMSMQLLWLMAILLMLHECL